MYECVCVCARAHVSNIYPLCQDGLLNGLPLPRFRPNLVYVHELLKMIPVESGPFFLHNVTSHRKHAFWGSRSGRYSENVPVEHG